MLQFDLVRTEIAESIFSRLSRMATKNKARSGTMVLASAINCALYNLLVRLLVRLNAPGIKDFVFAIAAPSSDCGEEAFTPAQKKARWIHQRAKYGLNRIRM